jgi:hypothetical protein
MPTRTRSALALIPSTSGFHQWETAPEAVKYLRSLHRHVFHVELEISVYHNDRELEYHMVLGAMNKFIDSEMLGAMWNNRWSCEDMAFKIVLWAADAYPDRPGYTCTISEDDENGSVVSLKA